MIGFFDSGIGGITVLQAAQALLPDTDFIYVADSAYAPYGEKSIQMVQERSLAITDFLIAQGAQVIVSACNTATSHAIDILRAKYSMPIIGMEPGIKPAVLRSQSKKIGVLATPSTLRAKKYQQLAEQLSAEVDVEIISQPCPGLVSEIEKGLDNNNIMHKLKTYIDPLIVLQVDAIVLGCSHYPLVKEAIAKVAGTSIQIIETSKAVAKHLYDTVQTIPANSGSGKVMYYSSADNAQVFYHSFGIKPPIHQLPV